MSDDTKVCVECGRAFRKSATDYTVRCMNCRTAGRKATGTRKWSEVQCDRCGTKYTTLNCPTCMPKEES